MGEYSNVLKAVNRALVDLKPSAFEVIEESENADGSTYERLSRLIWDKLYSFSTVARGPSALAGALWNLTGEFAGEGVVDTVWNIGDNLRKLFRKLSSQELSQGLLEILKDKEFRLLLANHSDLMEKIIGEIFRSGVSDVADKEKIDKEARNLIAALQKFVEAANVSLLSDVSSFEELQLKIKSADIAVEDRERVLDSIDVISNALMSLCECNPKLVQDFVLLQVLTSQDEAHVSRMSEADKALADALARRERDVGLSLSRYRANNSPEVGHFVDNYAENYIRSKRLVGVKIKGHNFSERLLRVIDFSNSSFQDISFAASTIEQVDFSGVIIQDAFYLNNAVIDADSFKTLVPSIRDAIKRGVDVQMRGCKVVGKADILDISGIPADSIDFSQLECPKIQNSTIDYGKDEIVRRRKVAALFERSGIADKIIKEMDAKHTYVENKKLFAKEVERKLFDVVCKKYSDPQELDVMLEILSGDTNSSDELNRAMMPVLHEKTTYERQSGTILGYFAGFFADRASTYRAKIDPEILEQHLDKYLDEIAHDPKYKYQEKLRRSKNKDVVKRADTITGHPERMKAAEDFIMLPVNAVVSDFMHYEPSQRPIKVGIIFRRLVVYWAPTSLKRLGYKNTKLGKLMESRKSFQLLRMGWIILLNAKELYLAYKPLAEILNDLNYGAVSKKTHEVQRARADVLVNLIKNKVLRKIAVEHDKEGKPLRRNEMLVPRENTVDFLCSTVDFLNNKDEVRVLLKEGYEILESLEAIEAADLFNDLVYIDDVNELRAKIVKHLGDKVSHAQMLKIKGSLDKFLVVFKRMQLPSTSRDDQRDLRYYFPHKETMKQMWEVINLDNNELVDLNKEVYKGGIVDFSNGEMKPTDRPLRFYYLKAKKFNAASSEFDSVIFEKCEFSGFKKEDKKNFVFKGANFDHAKISSCTFKDCLLSHFYGDGVKISETKLVNIQMQYSVLNESELSDVTMREVDLTGAEMRGCVIASSNLNSVKMNNVDFVNSHMIKSHVSEAQFKGGDFSGSSLWKSHFQHVNFEGANMVNVDLSRATLKDCSLKGVDLQGAKLEGLKLEGIINIDGARLSKSQYDALKRAARESGATLQAFPNRARLLKTSRTKSVGRLASAK